MYEIQAFFIFLASLFLGVILLLGGSDKAGVDSFVVGFIMLLLFLALLIPGPGNKQAGEEKNSQNSQKEG